MLTIEIICQTWIGKKKKEYIKNYYCRRKHLFYYLINSLEELENV